METQSPLIKSGWLRSLLFFFSFFIIAALFNIISIAIASVFSVYGLEEFLSDPELIMRNKIMMLMMVSQLAGVLFTVWIFQKFVNRESFTSIGLRFKGYKNDLYKGLLAGAGLISIGFITLIIFNLISVDLTYFSAYDQVFYLILFAVVSLNEEIG